MKYIIRKILYNPLSLIHKVSNNKCNFLDLIKIQNQEERQNFINGINNLIIQIESQIYLWKSIKDVLGDFCAANTNYYYFIGENIEEDEKIRKYLIKMKKNIEENKNIFDEIFM